MVDAIAAHTFITPRKFGTELVGESLRALGDQSVLSAVSKRLGEDLNRMTSLAAGIDIDGGRLWPRATDKHTAGDLRGLYDCILDLVYASVMRSTEHQTSFAGETILQTLANGEYGEMEFFEQLLQLERAPRVQNAVLLGQISTNDLVALRRAPETINLREWLRTQRGGDPRGADLLGEYTRSLGKLTREDNLLFSGLRLIVAMGIGTWNPAAGLLSSVVDWIFGQTYKQAAWSPRIFVDEALRQSLGQNRTHIQSVHVPFEIGNLLASGWSVASANFDMEVSFVLKRDKLETFKLTYGGSQLENQVIARNMQEIFRTGFGVLTFACKACGQRNRLSLDGKVKIGISCAKCKTPFLVA